MQVPKVIKQYLCVYCSYLGRKGIGLFWNWGCSVSKQRVWLNMSLILFFIISQSYHRAFSLAFTLVHIFSLPKLSSLLPPPTKPLLTPKDQFRSSTSPNTPTPKCSRVPTHSSPGGDPMQQEKIPCSPLSPSVSPSFALGLSCLIHVALKPTGPGDFLRTPELCSTPHVKSWRILCLTVKFYSKHSARLG